MEKEEKKTNVVEMTPKVKASTRKPKNEKLPYEQLENIAKQLYEQLAKSEQEIRRLNQSNLIARVNLLFRVLDHAEKFNQQFVQDCVDELEALIHIPDEEVTEPQVEEEKKEE